MKHFNNLFFLLIFCFLASSIIYANEHSNEYSVFHRTVNIEEVGQQQSLRNQSAWKQFQKRNGHWYVSFNTINQLPLRAAGTPIEVDIEGTLEDKARFFMATELKGFDIPLQNLKFEQTNETDKYYYVKFVQQYQNIDFWNASVQVVMTKQFEVVSFTMDVYNHEEIEVYPLIAQDLIGNFMSTSVKGTIDNVTIEGLKILPIPAANGYAYRLVYEGMVSLIDEDSSPERLYTLVDANNGTVYYRQNQIHRYEPPVQGEWTIMGNATTNANNPAELGFLPNMRVVVNGEEYKTDKDGRLGVELDEPTTATVYIQGDYCTVYEGPNRNSANIPRYEVGISNDVQQVLLPDDADLVAVSAYKSVNTVHDWMKFWLPAGMTSLDYSMPAHIDLTDGTCNAFADGYSINFFRQGGGCWTLALMADVIYHEYGHNINSAFYDFLGSNFFNGALGEGYADVWGLSITNEPILSRGYLMGSGNSFIRRYDIDPKVYPEDLTGEVHDDGEIIAGAWWDLGQRIGMNEMFEIFINSHYGTPMRGDGQEGLLYSDVLFQALIADDDNGNLADGTPNSEAIIEAFALHGIKLQLAAEVEHENIPLAAAENVVQIDFTVNVDFNYEPFVKGTVVKHKERGDSHYTVADAYNFNNDNNYTTWIVPKSKGTIIDYYIEVQSNIDAVPAVNPIGVTNLEFPNLTYQILVGYEEKIRDDFSELEHGWTIGEADDDASTGIWEIGTPNPTFNDAGREVQMANDNSPTNDNRCAFTGNANGGNGVGGNDIDDGKTTLLSPVYNVKGYTATAVSYYRWYSNDQGANPGNDFWEVYVSVDGGSWQQIEEANIADASWRFSSIRLKDYGNVQNTVQLRFVASDPLILNAGLQFDGGSIVEAGVDDIVVYDLADEEVGINDIKLVDNLVKIYPNPATEVLNIVNTYLGEGEASIVLFDLAGKQVFETKGVQLKNYQLNTSDLQQGVYLIRITFNNEMQQEKVVIYH
ncbi:MAG: T9SS type A sorting domain-containing protein [Chitinophagales bacterium]